MSPRAPAAVSAAAALTFASALIHASVIGSHFREWFWAGVFFVVITPPQVAWAYAITTRSPGRGLLLAGALFNASLAAVWVLSRTAGLPFGPTAWRPEAVGIKDVVATYAEVGAAVLVLAPRPPAWSTTAAWTLAVTGLVASFLSGH